MDLDELEGRYLHLRSDLARAYDAPVWDSHRIDCLTDSISDIESALAARCGVVTCHRGLPSSGGTEVAALD